jgi:hypothetical protein
MYKVDPNA